MSDTDRHLGFNSIHGNHQKYFTYASQKYLILDQVAKSYPSCDTALAAIAKFDASAEPVLDSTFDLMTPYELQTFLLTENTKYIQTVDDPLRRFCYSLLFTLLSLQHSESWKRNIIIV